MAAELPSIFTETSRLVPLNCIWTGVPFVRWPPYKACKRAGLMHTRVLVYMGLYKGLEQNLPSWKVMVRDVWPACKELGLHYKTYTFCVLYRLFEIHVEELAFFFENFASYRSGLWHFPFCIKKVSGEMSVFWAWRYQEKKIHSHTTVSRLLDHVRNKQSLQHFTISPNAFSSDPFLHQYKDWL